MQIHTTRGFTLLETVVAIGVFSVLMLMGTVALFTTIHAQQKTAASQRLIQNLDFAVDSMIRQIRTGTHYYCGPEASATTYQDTRLDCTSGITNDGGVLAVEGFVGNRSSGSDQYVFRYNNGQIERSSDGGQSFIGLTSPDVTIENFHVRVWGADSTDDLQPRVFIFIEGIAGENTPAETPFTLQTTVSQREFDQ